MDAKACQKEPMRFPIGINLAQTYGGASSSTTTTNNPPPSTQALSYINPSPPPTPPSHHSASPQQSALNTQIPAAPPPPAPFYNPNPPQAPRPPANNFSIGRGRSNRPRCQLCDRVGHLVDRCYHLFDRNYVPASYRQQEQYLQQPHYPDPNTYYQLRPYVPTYRAPYQHPPQPYVQHTHPYPNPQYSPYPAHSYSGPNPFPPRPNINVSEYNSYPQYDSYSPFVTEPQHALSSPTFTAPPPQAHSTVLRLQAPNDTASTSGVPLSSNTSTSQENATWLADSGATHHVTNDLSNLSVSNPYSGTSKVLIVGSPPSSIDGDKSFWASSSGR